MSNFDDLMGELAEVRRQNDWLVAAVRHLLATEAGIDLAEGEDDFDQWLAEGPLEDYAVEVPDHVAVRRPRAPVAPTATCSHQHQVLVGGVVRCARCGHGLIQSGVLNDSKRHGNEAARTEWGAVSLSESNFPG